MKTKILLIVFIGITFVNAQVTFEKAIDLNNRDVGRVAQQTSDNGYIIVGHTNINLNGKDVLLIKTNSLGDTIWSKTFGGSEYDTGFDVKETSDNGYIIIGSTNIFGEGSDVYLIKTDSLGNELWSNAIGGPYNDLGLSIQQTSDDGYIITGETTIVSQGNSDLFLIKTNEFGDVEWTRNYGGSGVERGNSIIITNDNCYVICGYTTSNSYGTLDVFLLKTDFTGDTIWTKAYGGTDLDCGMSVKQTNDYGFILSGYTKSFGAGDVDLYIIKTNDSGDTLWTRTYGGEGYDISCSVDITAENDFIIAGYGESFGSESIDVYLMKVNSLGDLLWTQIFEREYIDYGNSVQLTDDGGYVIVGTTFYEKFGSLYSDIYFIKTDGFGIVTGLKNLKMSSTKFEACPNPNNGIFKILNQHKVNLIEIYDIKGKLIYRDMTDYEIFTNPKINLGIGEKGMYFMKIYSDKEYYSTKFIIN